jgi:hypothetical protein
MGEGFDLKEGREKGKKGKGNIIGIMGDMWVGACMWLVLGSSTCSAADSATATIAMKCGANSFQLQPLSDDLSARRFQTCM